MQEPNDHRLRAVWSAILAGSAVVALAAQPVLASGSSSGGSSSNGSSSSSQPEAKCNAGVGNGHEGSGANETNDCDPGRSGQHNQAGKNWDKPRSPNAD